jgi:hypothetical protein
MPIRITCRNKCPDGHQVVEKRVFSTLRQEIGRCLIRTIYKIIASYADPSNICSTSMMQNRDKDNEG